MVLIDDVLLDFGKLLVRKRPIISDLGSGLCPDYTSTTDVQINICLTRKKLENVSEKEGIKQIFPARGKCRHTEDIKEFDLIVDGDLEFQVKNVQIYPTTATQIDDTRYLGFDLDYYDGN